MSEKHIRFAVILFFIPMYATVGFFMVDTTIDMLPTIAVLISSIGFLYRQNRKLVVRLYIANTLIWLIYAIPVEAYMHAINCTFILASLIVGILRHEKGVAFSIFPKVIKSNQEILE